MDQCLCDKCENCELLLRTLQAIGVKETPANQYKAVEKVVCCDHFQQVGTNFTFPKMECISGTCHLCGERLLEQLIKSENEEMM